MPEPDNKTEQEDAAAAVENGAEAEAEAAAEAEAEATAAFQAEIATLKDQLLRALAET